MSIYLIFIEKFASEDIHHNAQKGSVVIPTNEDQLQMTMMLKEQQQEPFDNGQMSSAVNNSEENGVEQSSTPMTTTQEISSADILDRNEQSSVVDDIACKVIINIIFE